jgi:hypothetical protein
MFCWYWSDSGDVLILGIGCMISLVNCYGLGVPILFWKNCQTSYKEKKELKWHVNKQEIYFNPTCPSLYSIPRETIYIFLYTGFVRFSILTYLTRSQTFQNILKLSKLVCFCFFHHRPPLNFISLNNAPLSFMRLSIVLFFIHSDSQPVFSRWDCCHDSRNRSSLDEAAATMLALGLLSTRLLSCFLRPTFSWCITYIIFHVNVTPRFEFQWESIIFFFKIFLMYIDRIDSHISKNYIF